MRNLAPSRERGFPSKFHLIQQWWVTKLTPVKPHRNSEGHNAAKILNCVDVTIGESLPTNLGGEKGPESSLGHSPHSAWSDSVWVAFPSPASFPCGAEGDCHGPSTPEVSTKPPVTSAIFPWAASPGLSCPPVFQTEDEPGSFKDSHSSWGLGRYLKHHVNIAL